MLKIQKAVFNSNETAVCQYFQTQFKIKRNEVRYKNITTGHVNILHLSLFQQILVNRITSQIFLTLSENKISHYNLKKKFLFSQDFIQKLVSLSGGFLSREDFEKLLSQFEKEAGLLNYFSRSAESNLLRIISASFDPVSLLNDCIKYPHRAEILIAVSANSNYLTDISVMNPEFLYQIFDSSYLAKPLSKEIIETELFEGINKFKSLRAKLNFIRSFKKRYTLKIGVNDILGNTSLEETTYQISILAKAILKYLFEICYDEVQNKHQTNFEKNRYTICALGKLGGDELNYSSDVDLILFYDKNSESNENTKKEFYEILAESTQLFVQSATDITDKGYIYRIDFRLRPDGKNSPLCRTINDYLRYYETRGEDWERQMLIKLSFVGGSENLYNSFADYLQGYIYPASFSVSPVEQIKRLRKSIENRIGGKENIKLFAGGIRDIEFSIQALQLINGGKFKQIRTGTTLKAIDELQKINIIKPEEALLYKSAYVFYRRVEHFLQLMNDTQTHEIPSEGEMLEKLSSFMKFKSSAAFKKEVAKYRKKVRAIYNSIIEKDTSEITDSKNFLEKINFENRISAEKNYNYLKTGTGLLEQKQFDAKIINLFLQIEPYLVKYLSRSAAPDKVLDNFVRIVKSTSFHSIWYSEFANLKFFNMFLTICEFSQKAVDLITNDKSCAELLISRNVFTTNIENLFEKISFNKLLFVLSVQLSLDLIKQDVFSRTLSNYISYKLDKICAELNFNYKFFIAGLGSFATGEMNFSSDVDLIVVAEKIEVSSSIQNDFQKFLSAAKKVLNSLDVDFRLRPEGKSSPLVWDIKAYEDYLNSRARIWEFQTLNKLKFVSGDEKLFYDFKNIVCRKVKTFEKEKVKNELKEMFEKMRKKNYGTFESYFDLKKSKGGLINIEFILQSILLLDPEMYFKTMGSGTPAKIKILAKSKKGFEDLKSLSKTFAFLKSAELVNQYIFNVKGSIIKEEKFSKELLSRKMKFQSIIEFDRALRNSIDTNNSFLQKYL